MFHGLGCNLLFCEDSRRSYISRARCAVAGVVTRERMEKKETIRKAEALVEKAMKGNDASHDAAHVWRVRDLALSLATEEGLSSDPHSMEIVTILPSSYFCITIIFLTFLCSPHSHFSILGRACCTAP